MRYPPTMRYRPWFLICMCVCFVCIMFIFAELVAARTAASTGFSRRSPPELVTWLALNTRAAALKRPRQLVESIQVNCWCPKDAQSLHPPPGIILVIKAINHMRYTPDSTAARTRQGGMYTLSCCCCCVGCFGGGVGDIVAPLGRCLWSSWRKALVYALFYVRFGWNTLIFLYNRRPTEAPAGTARCGFHSTQPSRSWECTRVIF